MLTRLSIRDIVLIEHLELDFSGGLSVLTGETGTGKSILLDAFALALGGRGDVGLVRQGAEQGQVTAVFEPPFPTAASDLLTECGIPAEDELILRRAQLADGRTRAFVNDQPVSAQVLRRVGDALVEIHGQHAERALLDTSAHRRLLDAFGGLEEQALEVAGRWDKRRSCDEQLAGEREHVEAARREAEWLRHAAEELGRLAPQASEEAALAERRTWMQQGEKVAAELRDAHAAISGTESPLPLLSAAVRRLERRSTQAPALIDPVVQALDAGLRSLEEARLHLAHALAASEHDPGELERIEERLFALRAAGRKYNVPVHELAELATRYANDLAALDAGAERIVQLENAAAEARSRYGESAAALSQQRKAVAQRLDNAVNRELKPLRLERARFVTQVVSEQANSGRHGSDRVEFWVQTNPGTLPGALMKVASGGELARFLLALKVVLADRGSAPTLVFDEVDTAVGGAVADAIGARLARLARRNQVIAVTHAPQVAARADRHYLISKRPVDAGRRVVTRVAEIAADTRREEIARMLAGAEITAEARAAAERLIRAAG
jgi:DNA repair protein RecN (Recombination protein N)